MKAREALELVPVPARRAQAVLHAEIPLPEAKAPPRVYLNAATEALKDRMPWGETGAEFLKTVFHDQLGQPRNVLVEDIVGHCLARAGNKPQHEVQHAAIRQLERFEDCGLVLTDSTPIRRTTHFLNPAHGMAELLQLKEQEGAKILETRLKPFDAGAAKELLEDNSFGAAFKPGTTGADFASRLADRTLVSTLLKDDSLFQDGASRGWQVRSRIEGFLNAGISCGALKFERIEKNGEVREVYSVTDDAKPLLTAIQETKS